MNYQDPTTRWLLQNINSRVAWFWYTRINTRMGTLVYALAYAYMFITRKHFRYSDNYTTGPHIPGCERTFVRIVGTEANRISLSQSASFNWCTCRDKIKHLPSLRGMPWK